MYNYPANRLIYTDGDILEIGGGKLKLTRGQERYEIPYRDIGGGSPPAPVTGGDFKIETVEVNYPSLSTTNTATATQIMQPPEGFEGATPYLIGCTPHLVSSVPFFVFSMQVINPSENIYKFLACSVGNINNPVYADCHIMWVKE